MNLRYLWDTKYVKSLLANRSLTEEKSFAYFFAIMGFDWLQFTTIQLMRASNITDWERTGIVLTFLLTILGILFLFWCNGGIKGKDFLYRYFPLSFIVGWKFLICASTALWILGFLLHDTSKSFVGWASTIVMTVINLAMFLRIGVHMKELALGTEFSNKDQMKLK
jgi:hypothetical protein